MSLTTIMLFSPRSLGIPAGIQSMEDNLIMTHAEKLNLPFTSGLVLFKKMTKETGITFPEVNSSLVRFANIDDDKDGWITPEDMAVFLSIPNDACLKALFWTIDQVRQLKI